MGNAECGMRSAEWGMGNGEWGMSREEGRCEGAETPREIQKNSRQAPKERQILSALGILMVRTLCY